MPASRPGIDKVAPRQSLCALWGTAWAGFAVVFVAGCVLSGYSPDQLDVFHLLLLLPSLAAPVVVPILGKEAVNQIRRSEGRVSGLGWALFDLFFFPLLGLNALIGWGLYRNFGLLPGELHLKSILILTVVLSVLIDVPIICWAWRAVNRPIRKDRNMIEQKYRTFDKRCWAGLVDGFVFLPIMLLDRLIWAHHGGIPNVLLALFHLANSMIYYAYSIYFLGKYGQTLGKMALKIKVLDVSEQQHVTYLQALKRDIVPLVVATLLLPYELYQIIVGKFYLQNPGAMPDKISLILAYSFMGWFLLEIITMMFSSKRRAIHDFIAGSVVVRT
jgi:uncharacterized RDD family membrane protein YckC